MVVMTVQALAVPQASLPKVRPGQSGGRPIWAAWRLLPLGAGA